MLVMTLRVHLSVLIMGLSYLFLVPCLPFLMVLMQHISSRFMPVIFVQLVGIFGHFHSRVMFFIVRRLFIYLNGRTCSVNPSVFSLHIPRYPLILILLNIITLNIFENKGIKRPTSDRTDLKKLRIVKENKIRERKNGKKKKKTSVTLFTLNTPMHDVYQKIEHNEANGPDEDGRPESHICRNVTN
ncbi:hypothetical protein MSSIH_0137 [Methanosarcina siciliae HI350]|nr:hypothetical protein MSSIH_0137 [Methanosarcina siciliae HI350]